MPIHWKDNADKGLRGTWGNGSKTTDKRAHRDQRQLKLAASQSYSIDSLFARQKSLGLHAKDTSLKDVPRACSPPPTEPVLEKKIGKSPRKSLTGFCDCQQSRRRSMALSWILEVHSIFAIVWC
jgi:hypothetical protein